MSLESEILLIMLGPTLGLFLVVGKILKPVDYLPRVSPYRPRKLKAVCSRHVGLLRVGQLANIAEAGCPFCRDIQDNDPPKGAA
jgi:hypothetical protein